MSSDDELDIEQDRQIDADALDVAWLEQPNLYYKYSNAMGDAMDERNQKVVEVDEHKEKVNKVKAELDAEIRDDPESFDLEKVTESSIQSAIIRSERYQSVLKEYHDARKELNEAQNKVNKLYSCVGAMEQRKGALEGLARLLNQQYFATPTEPKQLSEKYHEKTAKAKKGAREKVKRQRKRRKSE